MHFLTSTAVGCLRKAYLSYLCWQQIEAARETKWHVTWYFIWLSFIILNCSCWCWTAICWGQFWQVDIHCELSNCHLVDQKQRWLFTTYKNISVHNISSMTPILILYPFVIQKYRMETNECEICQTRFKYALDKLTDVNKMAVSNSMMETKYRCSLVTLQPFTIFAFILQLHKTIYAWSEC